MLSFRPQTNQRVRTLFSSSLGHCIIDEVDLVLHPLRSELNFPVGPKEQLDFAPMRWHVALHLLDGWLCAHGEAVPTKLEGYGKAHDVARLARP